MGTITLALFQILIISSVFLPLLPQISCVEEDIPSLAKCGFNAIYNFGGSTMDTGNAIEVKKGELKYDKFPYGKTIHVPTGRVSDGLIILDYIAKSANLSLIDAYMNKSATYASGVNFATAGATGLPKSFFEKNNINLPFYTNSFEEQLQWCDNYLKGFCKNPKECEEKFKSSLFIVFYGPNDYVNVLNAYNSSIEEIKKRGLVTAIVEGIKHAVTELINRGAKQVLVIGMTQLGCSDLYLFSQKKLKNETATYDRFNCLKDFNDLFMYHNDRLNEGLQELRKEHHNVEIVYGDLFNSMQWVMDNSQSLGFKTVAKACCGPFNATDGKCGDPGTPECSNPEEYIFWDMGHFTQNANKQMTSVLIKNSLKNFRCNA